jgi:hypothetical protein
LVEVERFGFTEVLLEADDELEERRFLISIRLSFCISGFVVLEREVRSRKVCLVVFVLSVGRTIRTLS